jgi:hypothetical protein
VAPGPAKRSLLFLHVPKTGGAALTGVLSNRFAAGDCLQLYFGPEPDLRNLERFRYVSGHLSLSYLDRFQEPPFIVTFLRDPIDRALSSYSYARSLRLESQPPVLLPGRGPEAHERLGEYMRLTRECSIDELVRRAPELAREYLGNRQARVLCGVNPEGVGETLEDALEALDRCDFVGLTERLDESAAWLARRLGWRELGTIPRSNVTSDRVRREQLSAAGMDALLELTSIDRELYRHACPHYERRLADWSTASDPRDPSAAIPDAHPVSDLGFDAAIPGGGWLGRERLDDEPWFCWIGHTLRAWVDLAAAPGTDCVVAEIPHVLEPTALETLRITVDGEVVPHRLQEFGGTVVASAPLERRRLRRRGRTARVTLEVDSCTRPCDVDPGSPDARELAIAVRRIGLVKTDSLELS